MSSARRDGSQFWGTDGPELLAALNEATEQIRVLEARRLELVAKLGRIQAHDAAGYSSLPAFLVQTQRVSMRTAKQWVTHAQQITETLTPTGHVTPAPLPTARVAVLAGAIGAEHLEVITKAVEALPASVSVADREVVEQSLADYPARPRRTPCSSWVRHWCRIWTRMGWSHRPRSWPSRRTWCGGIAPRPGGCS